MESDSKIQIHYIDGAFFLNCIETVKKIRTNHHLVATPILQPPPDPKRKMVETLFVLDKYSVLYLHQFHPDSLALKGDCEQVLKDTQKESKATIFLDLYNQGYYVLSGSKYGADFAIYQDDPLVVHAAALIFVLEPENEKEGFNLIELNRVSTIVKKECVIAVIRRENGDCKVKYEGINRCAVSWHKTEDGKRRKK